MKSGSTSLSGLSVLVLRSARIDDPLTKALSAAGATVASYPIFAIEAIDFPVASSFFNMPSSNMRLSQVSAESHSPCYDSIIFVSRHAVSHGLGVLQQAGIEVDQAEVAAIGATTAGMLNDWGINAFYPTEQASTESLLAMPEMKNVAGRRLLIVRGQGGRETLKNTLIERGAEVTYCEVYRRVLDARHADAIRVFLNNERQVIVLAHSGDIVRAYAELLRSGNFLNAGFSNHTSEEVEKNSVWELPCITPGFRVADIARECGFKQVITASSALPSDMEQALRYWYTQQSDLSA